MSDLVSIIIPAYNIEAWIERCLNSVCRQTYHNLQIIVVNDGSGDRTGEICDRFAREDQRVIVFHQKNQGVSCARNHGLELAKGKYICFVDGDDWVEADYIEELYHAMSQDNSQMAICGYIEENEQGVLLSKRGPNAEILQAENVLEKIFFQDSIGRSLWNKLLLRSIIENHQIRFSSEYQVGEDMLFLIQYLLKTEQVSILEKTEYHYLWRTGSAMQKRVWNQKYYRNRRSWLQALECAQELLAEQDENCRKTFEVYQQMVWYRILCESTSLVETDQRKTEMEQQLLKKVRRYGWKMICSGRLPLKTAVGVAICCISPKLQVKVARMK